MYDKNLFGWHFNNNTWHIFPRENTFLLCKTLLHLCHKFDYDLLYSSSSLIASCVILQSVKCNCIWTGAFWKFKKLFSNYTTAISDWYQIIYSGVKQIENSRTVKSYWIQDQVNDIVCDITMMKFNSHLSVSCHWCCKQILEPFSFLISCTF